jgi:hypothetical protein
LKETKKQLIEGYYSFHFLDPELKKVRVGNFIDESYITNRIEDDSDWSGSWGISHEILMKILIESGFLRNSEK